MFAAKTDDINKITHTSMDDIIGKFLFKGKNKKTFYRLYSKCIENGVQMYVNERRKDVAPLYFDFDIERIMSLEQQKHFQEHPHATMPRLYTTNMISTIITIVTKHLKYYLDVADNAKLQCYVFEKSKSSVKDGTKIKDGLHLMYPMLAVHYKFAFAIREKLIEELSANDEFVHAWINPEDRPQQPEQTEIKNQYMGLFDRIVDFGIMKPKSNWLMYGSKKSKDKLPYLVSCYYDHACQRHTNPHTIKDMVDLFSVRKYSSEEVDNISLEKELELKAVTDKVFNRLHLNFDKNKQQTQFQTQMMMFDPEKQEEMVNIHHLVMNLLNDERAEQYESWVNVGYALHSLGNQYLQLWIEFSQRCPSKFQEGVCEKKWFMMRDEGYTIGSLYRWAKEDNPTGFQQFKDDIIKKKVEQGLDGTTYGTANLMFQMYRGEFVCANLKDQWFQFIGHRWIEVNSGYTLFARISTEVAGIYQAKKAKICAKFANPTMTQKERDEIMRNEVKPLDNIIIKLQTNKFKEDVMKEAARLFYDDKFIDRINENRDLLCFENGVFNLAKNEFRAGRPEDYITFTTKINYVPYDPNNPITKEVLKFFEQVHPLPHLRKYFLTLLSSCLDGHIRDQKFHIWTGSGSNGKSLTINVVEKTFGDYYMSIDNTLLTQKRLSINAHNPALCDTKGRRIAVMQETEETDKLYVGHMKQLTGGDEIKARRPYDKRLMSFFPQLVWILICNKLPNIPSNDGGTWRRLRREDFTSKFVERPEKPNEFLMDKTLQEKIKRWPEAFMGLLVHYYNTVYKKEGLVEPIEVVNATNEYQAVNDHYQEFINEYFIKTGIATDRITVDESYEEFRIWFRDYHSESKLPSKTMFRTNISETVGKLKNNKYWSNYKLRVKNDDFTETNSITDDGSVHGSVIGSVRGNKKDDSEDDQSNISESDNETINNDVADFDEPEPEQKKRKAKKEIE
jgi:P4 family phage/plasmid primase-like protien